MSLSEKARVFLKRNKIKRYTLNSDGTIDVDGSACIITKQSKLSVKFGKVTGHFYCDHSQIISLEGVPSYVGGYFSCEDIKLTSLHDIHKHIKEINGYFYCRNKINDSVLGLLMIKGITKIILENTEVQNILNKHIEQGRAGIFDAQRDLLDAGLDEYARL